MAIVDAGPRHRGWRAFLSEALDSTEAEPSAERALALYGDGLFAFWQGAQAESRQRNEAALEAARASGDARALALAHLGLSRVALRDGDYGRGREHAVSTRRQAAALEPAMGQAPLHRPAQSRWGAGDLDEAAALFAESLELNRRIGDEGMVGVELHNLGHVEARRGNVEIAERLLEECARLGSVDDPSSLASREVNAATVAFARGDPLDDAPEPGLEAGLIRECDVRFPRDGELGIVLACVLDAPTETGAGRAMRIGPTKGREYPRSQHRSSDTERTCDGETTQAKYGPNAARAIG